MKKVLTILFSLIVVLAVAQERTGSTKPFTNDPSCAGFVISPVDNVTVFPGDLIESILGPDITSYTLTSFVGYADAVNGSAGLFTGGMAAGIGIEEGIGLCSGYLRHAIGPNAATNIAGYIGTGGDADLSGLIGGGSTYDATVLEFDFVPNFDEIFIQFVLGSDEYTEWLGFNDVFGFFLNGVNIALIPGTSTAVSISNINPNSYPAYYKSNESYPGPYCTEMDGFTTVLTGSGTVTNGASNTIKLAISDAYDDYIDSFVFIKGESFSGVDPEVPVSNWALFIGIGLILIFAVIRFRRLV